MWATRVKRTQSLDSAGSVSSVPDRPSVELEPASAMSGRRGRMCADGDREGSACSIELIEPAVGEAAAGDAAGGVGLECGIQGSRRAKVEKGGESGEGMVPVGEAVVRMGWASRIRRQGRRAKGQKKGGEECVEMDVVGEAAVREVAAEKAEVDDAVEEAKVVDAVEKAKVDDAVEKAEVDDEVEKAEVDDAVEEAEVNDDAVEEAEVEAEVETKWTVIYCRPRDEQ